MCRTAAEEKDKGNYGAAISDSRFKMIALFQRLLDWFKSLFWKEEMELTLVGLQYSGKTTFVNVIAVSAMSVMSVNDEVTHDLLLESSGF